MRIIIKPTVAVIIPTVGSPKFEKAYNSVRSQTFTDIDIIRVVDGPIENSSVPDQEHYTIQLPFNTGKSGYYGHRIYAAVPHLLDHDFIFFLDEDNWYEPDHVDASIEAFSTNPGVRFVHSLRNIVDENENFICRDDCESLGTYPVYWSTNEHLVDTSSFSFRNDFIKDHCHIWHHGWGGDRRFFNAVRSNPYACTGKYTLNYRLDGNPNSVKPEFFLEGNKIMSHKYGERLPWVKH